MMRLRTVPAGVRAHATMGYFLNALVVLYLAHLAWHAPWPPSPLYRAARNGDLAEAERLLAAGAAVNVGRSLSVLISETPLANAASSGHAAVVSALLAAGADRYAGTTVGPWGVLASITPLCDAADNGHAAVVDVLLKAGASADRATTVALGLLNSTPALFQAAQHGHAARPAAIVSALLRAGASPSAGAKFFGGAVHTTPLEMANENRHTEVAALLTAALERQTR
jgi:ankyrin repeat protein